MNKNRLEAFSDGVLAIIITIMVLEFKVPHGSGFEDLKPLIPKVLSYILSFIYIGIYWGNHHHLLHTVRQVNSGMIWANLHLLFWLSLIPFATDWMGENHFSPNTVAVYGFILLMCGAAFGCGRQVWVGSFPSMDKSESSDSPDSEGPPCKDSVGSTFSGTL